MNSTSTFKKDMKESKQKEIEFATRLQMHGFTTTVVSDTITFSDYDVKAWHPAQPGRVATYEIKYDRKAATTGNIAVEACKMIDGKKKASGLTSTKASWYVYTFPQDPNFYVIPTNTLVSMVMKEEFKAVIQGGDNSTSTICLFSKEHILNQCSVL